MQVRALNHAGMDAFESFLEQLRSGRPAPIPADLLQDPATTSPVSATAYVEDRGFDSRMDAARYFDEQLEALDSAERDHDRGLWSWLALFYFERLCPGDEKGCHKPGKSYRYIPTTHWQHFYRHLLLGPYRIFTTCGDLGRVMLSGPFGSHGDFSEQIASRQELLTNTCVIGLVDLLYYDPLAAKPKPGATDRKKSGNVRRLISLLDQLDLTYDLYAMDPHELQAILPAEFDIWRQRAA